MRSGGSQRPSQARTGVKGSWSCEVPPVSHPPSFMPPCGRRQVSEARLHPTQWGGSRPAACPAAASLLPAPATRDLTDPLSLPVRDKGRRSDDGRIRFRIRTRRLWRDARLRGVGNRSHHQMASELPSFVGAHRSFRDKGRSKDHGSAQYCRTVRSRHSGRLFEHSRRRAPSGGGAACCSPRAP